MSKPRYNEQFHFVLVLVQPLNHETPYTRSFAKYHEITFSNYDYDFRLLLISGIMPAFNKLLLPNNCHHMPKSLNTPLALLNMITLHSQAQKTLLTYILLTRVAAVFTLTTVKCPTSVRERSLISPIGGGVSVDYE